MYSREKFKKLECINEKNNKKCEYLMICPYFHKEDEKMQIGESRIFSYYNEKIKMNLQMIKTDITLLKQIKNMHSCISCKNFLTRNYIVSYPCGHIVCKECSKKVKF